MNQFKAGLFCSPKQLQTHRLALTQEELTQFWFNKNLVQMEKILTITDQNLINYIVVQQYLQYFLSNKKISPNQAYYVMKQEKILMYVYDGRLFKNLSYEKYQRDLISAYMIAYRDNYCGEEAQLQNLKLNFEEEEQVFQFLDTSLVKPKQWVVKIKQSALLRIFTYLIHRFLNIKNPSFQPTERNQIGGFYANKRPYDPKQVVILQPQHYYSFMYNLLPKYSYSPQTSAQLLFNGLTELMLNNLLLAWYGTLTLQQKYQRHYKRCFRTIQKPKNKQEFTSIQDRFNQIKWQGLKTFVYRLKYEIKQKENCYECYQIQQKQWQNPNQTYQQLQQQDINILRCFHKARISAVEYQSEYGQFYEPQY